MNLMYGDYSSNIVSHYAPSYPVGNPKFDNWLEYKQKYSNREELYKELKLDITKKTLLYMPTWGSWVHILNFWIQYLGYNQNIILY